MNSQESKNKPARQDTHYTIVAKSLAEAEKIFSRGVANLLSINQWKDIAGGMVSFQLVNENGAAVFTAPRKLNYIRVWESGATEPEYEWFQIERIDHYKTSLMESAIIRVQPAQPPHLKSTPRYSGPDAANNFSVERMENKVTAAVHGRQGHPRIKSLARPGKLRSFFYHMGNLFGLNKSIWKTLVRGLLQKETGHPELVK